MAVKNESGRARPREMHTRAREVIRHTGGIVRVKFPSTKNGRMIHCEGLLELDAAYLFETSPRVKAYREQPISISYPDGSKIRRYTPDFAVDLNSGTTVLLEIKPAARLAADDIRHKFDCIKAYFQRREQAFEILTDILIRTQPRLDAARSVHRHASHQLTSAAALEIALQRHRRGFPMSLRRRSDLLGKGSITPYCLLRAGLLRADTSVPLDDNAQLHLPEDFQSEQLLSESELGF